MKPTPSIIQRLLAVTPPFWKGAQIIALVVLAIAGTLSKFNILPTQWYVLISGICGGIALISQFAVQDSALLADFLQNPESIIIHLPELIKQVKDIRDALIHPAAADISTIATQINVISQPSAAKPTPPDAEAKVVQMPVTVTEAPQVTA